MCSEAMLWGFVGIGVALGIGLVVLAITVGWIIVVHGADLQMSVARSLRRIASRFDD